MNIEDNCESGRNSLPLLPCSNKTCPWVVNDIEYRNCFFVLLQHISVTPDYEMSIEDIAKMEGISEQEVVDIIEKAEKKIRIKHKVELSKI
ncbi:MAG: hypothetical protein WC444_05475 [Candidatus Paceibacterota bacterium]